MFEEFVDKDCKLVFKDGSNIIVTPIRLISESEGFLRFENLYHHREVVIPVSAVLKLEVRA